jgi:hypothetical protein
MAPSQESINQLRYQLAASRAGLTRATSVLGASLDVPGRVRQEVATHPLKWAMVAIVGGVVASRVLPVALRLVQTAASRRLVGTVVATLAPLAVRAGVKALAARRPDLLEAFMGGAAPAPASAQPPSSFGG